MGPVQLLKVSRPGFWPTHLWFFLLPFGQRDMFGSALFFLGCAYVCFPLGLMLYGLNDLYDAETDRLNDRKDSWLFGARLSDAGLRVLPGWMLASQVPFAVLFTALAGWRVLGWFAAMVAVNVLYNVPPFAFKNRPVVDVLNQAGYLLVFVLASWLCGVPQLSVAAMGFSALFAMHSHVFGQLMDVDADRAAGRRTTVGVVGVRAGKLLIAALMWGEAAIAFVTFRHWAVAAFSAAGAVFFTADGAVRAGAYPKSVATALFVGWNLVVLSSMYLVWRSGIFVL